MASQVPSVSPPASPSAAAPSLKRRRGDTSNTLIHQVLNNPALLTSADLGEQMKHIHRINPVSARKKAKHADGESATVFNDQSGHHEWIPTSMAEEVLKQGDPIWLKLWTALRSPTWLLILRPDVYCTNKAGYDKVIADVIGKIEAARVSPVPALAAPPSGSTKPPPAKKPKFVAPPSVSTAMVPTTYAKASQLGLVGHSGGLNIGGSDQTTFQSTWHDELRDIYRNHAPALVYDAYWAELIAYIRDHFLFFEDLSLPGVSGTSVTASEVMAHIEWDMSISGRGNPPAMPKKPTMLNAAQYLRSEWSGWGQGLNNTFRAFRNF